MIPFLQCPLSVWYLLVLATDLLSEIDLSWSWPSQPLSTLHRTIPASRPAKSLRVNSCAKARASLSTGRCQQLCKRYGNVF